MSSELLIQKLLEDTRQILNEAEGLKSVDSSKLVWRLDKSSWSMLECIEHLNRYGNFYLPQIRNKLQDSTSTPEGEFNSGLLGRYFATSMLPKAKLNRMKTMKNMNPLNADLDKRVIDIFIDQQISLLELLNQSRNVSLNSVRIKTSISSLIRLKLGDTFQFLVNHNKRHFNQIARIKDTYSL